MEKLNDDNSLTWDNFTKKYSHENYYGDYFSSNSYEDMFINNEPIGCDNFAEFDNNTDIDKCANKTDSINEEYNINTESD
jgi:hypothetical protein